MIVLALGYFAYTLYVAKQQVSLAPTSSAPLVVQVIEAERHTIFDEIEALGTAIANEAVNITSTETDKVEEILFEDGQFVKKGQILVLLRQEEELAQKKAQEELLKENERELKRLEDLVKRNATSKNEYDARQTLLMISKQRIAEITARIEDKTIRAPFDGILGLRNISVGSLVEPGAIITTIDDISQIKLDFQVPSLYLDVVKQGLVIKAESEAFPNRKFQGKVTTLSPRVDPITRTIVVRAILPNQDRLIKPGLLLSVDLLRNERQALMIPEEAIVQRQKRHLILTVDEVSKVNQQDITIGKRKRGWVEVLSGLEPGQMVITRGITRVRPGDQVNIERASLNMPNRSQSGS